MNKKKSLIRTLDRKGSRSDKSPAVARKTANPRPRTHLEEPAACERCGAIFVRKTWRKNHSLPRDLMARVHWVICPGCGQADSRVYFGRVLVQGLNEPGREAEVRARIKNIDARARFTQPERRVVSIDRRDDVLEVLTTSQKLAHRMARELEKAFGGRSHYAWSDDGSLLAVWECRSVPS